MTTITLPKEQPTLTPTGFFQRLWQTNWLLAATAVSFAVLFFFTLLANMLDSRLVTGAPVWIKPMKFAISTVLYCGTLAWMLSFVQGWPRLVKIVGHVTALTLAVEIVLITLQAVRGVRSHFNFTTPFDGAVFSIMGTLIMVVWAMNLLAAFLLLRQQFADASFAWSLRLGLLVTAVGAALGFFMTSPTPAQMAQIQAGNMPQFIGAHSVGVADGGPGLPFTGWSTEGGDVRVSHFVGLHALQAIPAVGILVNRYLAHRLAPGRRTALVWVAGLGYLGLTLLTLWQALRSQPLTAPDVLTLAGFVGLVSAVFISIGFIIWRPAKK